MFALTGIWRYVVPGLAGLLLIAVIVGSVKSCKETEAESNNQVFNAGVVTEREAIKGEVLTDVQEARNAVSAPSDADIARVCSKYDRNCPARNQ
jgi:hypothetical protein